MPRKNKGAAKPKKTTKPRAPRPPRANKSKIDFDVVKRMVNGGDSPSNSIEEVRNWIVKQPDDKRVNFILNICNQQETASEKRELISSYLQTI